MGSPRLRINGQDVGLRRLDDDVFEPKSKKILSQVLTGEAEFNISRPTHTLTPFNSGAQKYHKIESFCFVTSFNRIKEAKILLYSLRQFHSEPVIIICDKDTEEHLRKLRYDNITIIPKITDKYLEHIHKKILQEKYSHLEAEHHCRSDYIYIKMECMNEALARHSNTFFLDTDIIVLGNLQEKFTKKIALSPHYYSAQEQCFGYEYGFYNAGYIFCADRGFPQFWKDLYLNDSIFYEQECMNRIPLTYQIETFDDTHNCGFWRQHNFPDEPTSLHVHITDEVVSEMSDAQSTLHKKFKNICLSHIKSVNIDLYGYICKVTGITKKVAFVHGHKCAGVYVERYLSRKLIPNYTRFCSWHKHLNPLNKTFHRDWTDAELLSITNQTMVSEKYEHMYVHNHNTGWNLDTVKAYKRGGWFMFTFLRDPKEIICSLYYFALKQQKLKGVKCAQRPLYEECIHMANHRDISRISLDTVFKFIVTEEIGQKFWKLPEYINLLDYVAEFTNDNFSYFCKTFFNHNYTPIEPQNVSDNKGYEFYCKNGDISTESQNLIETSPEYLKYIQYMNK